jgi:cation transport regulator
MCGGVVPYSSNNQLPPSVRNYLPSHRQDIHREAFNHACQEQIAHRVAWAAVKRLYHKDIDELWHTDDDVL